MNITLKAVLVMLVAPALAGLGGWIRGAAGPWRAEEDLVKADAGRLDQTANTRPADAIRLRPKMP